MILLTTLLVSAGPELAAQTTLVIKVTDRVKAADALAAEAEKRSGWFTSRTDDSIALRVPAAEADALAAFAETLGKTVQRQTTASDAAAELTQLRAVMKSKEETLQRYYAVIAEASAAEVVAVEREMTRLVQEIEATKGRIRLLEHQVAYAGVTVHFQFIDRRPPVRDGRSSFAWLNTMNLADLLERFSE